MNKKGLLLYLMMFTFICGFSQKKESYNLELYNSRKDIKYKIDYQKTNNNIFLVVSKETSIRKFSKIDSLKIFRLIETKSSDSKKEIAKIIENYKEYKSDTLVIESGDFIEEKIDEFVENWNDLKVDLKLNPDQRIILDGYWVKLSLETNHQKYEEIYAQTPTEKSHPTIFKLIADLENYYRKNSKNPVID